MTADDIAEALGDMTAAADGTDTQRHYDNPPTTATASSTEEPTATPVALLATFDPAADCGSNYYTGLNDDQHPGQSVTVDGTQLQRVGFYNQTLSLADYTDTSTEASVTVAAEVYDGNVTDYATATLLGQGSATLDVSAKMWVDVDLDAPVDITSGQQVTVLFTTVGFGGYDDGYMFMHNSLGVCIADTNDYAGGNEVVRTASGSTSVSTTDLTVRVDGQP